MAEDMASDYDRIEAERKIQEEVDYERGYREGYTKARAAETVTTTLPSDAYNAGLHDGFQAVMRGELNKYDENQSDV